MHESNIGPERRVPVNNWSSAWFGYICHVIILSDCTISCSQFSGALIVRATCNFRPPRMYNFQHLAYSGFPYFASVWKNHSDSSVPRENIHCLFNSAIARFRARFLHRNWNWRDEVKRSKHDFKFEGNFFTEFHLLWII